MKLNKQQFEALQVYEPYFSTAVNSQWARHPGQAGLQTILEIYILATGDRRRVNGSCQTCILHLLQDCGKLYFAEKAEREKAKVSTSMESVEFPKVAVKTTTRKKTTKK